MFWYYSKITSAVDKKAGENFTFVHIYKTHALTTNRHIRDEDFDTFPALFASPSDEFAAG